MVNSQGNTAINKGLKRPKMWVRLFKMRFFLKSEPSKDKERFNFQNDCKSYYLSLCFGQKYPDERMLSERMFGSMMVSSASGLFRIRPGTSQ